MASFRPATAQARHLVIKKVIHGKSRHAAKASEEKFIASISTEHTYRSKIAVFVAWLQLNKIDVKLVTSAVAQEFLELKALSVTQKTVDCYRQAIRMVFDLELSYAVSKRETCLEPRAYSREQVALLAAHASPSLALSIRISAWAGLRAVELDTIARADEMQEDKRAWLPDRFFGREGEVRYVVVGKGGLRRTVLLPPELAKALESQRLPKAIIKRSRCINYRKRYALVGGHMFSQQFTRLSNRVLGWSNGAHGLRHAFAQNRMRFLQAAGFDYEDALLILSQEVGHFSTANTVSYLR